MATNTLLALIREQNPTEVLRGFPADFLFLAKDGSKPFKKKTDTKTDSCFSYVFEPLHCMQSLKILETVMQLLLRVQNLDHLMWDTEK